jgi:hypothetical protein
MLVSRWIKVEQAVVSAALVCYEHASVGEVVCSTHPGLYGGHHARRPLAAQRSKVLMRTSGPSGCVSLVSTNNVEVKEI